MKVLLVDDHTLFVAAVKSVLEDNNIQVVGTAGDGLEALEQVRALSPDVVLMDINMPRCGGVEATRRIKAEFPHVKVVMLTMSADDHDLFMAIKSGASGYITKDVNLEVFLGLLAGLTQGEAAVTHQMVTRILGEFVRSEQRESPASSRPAAHDMTGVETDGELSPRQLEILRQIIAGYTYKEIAVALSISERTVNYHMREILDKLQLQTRAQVIVYATRRGLIGTSLASQ